MSGRSYAQYCPVAEALDILGERWTLLILRELLVVGDLRFTDLRHALPGLAPNLLSERLRQLESHGLVERKELPPPAARTVYAATELGRQVRPVLRALARFGAGRLPPPDPATPVRPAMAVHGSLIVWHRAAASRGVSQHYRLVLDGEQFDFAVDDGRLYRAGPDGPADLVVRGSAGALVAARQGGRGLAAAVEAGELVVEGPAAVLERFEQVFALAPPG
ncbi:MAG: winged helix-turn-helix transcriptional regulator [Acidimicrobiales bacterium]